MISVVAELQYHQMDIVSKGLACGFNPSEVICYAQKSNLHFNPTETGFLKTQCLFSTCFYALINIDSRRIVMIMAVVAASGVHFHSVPVSTTEELTHRRIQLLPKQIPQRYINARECFDIGAPLPKVP